MKRFTTICMALVLLVMVMLTGCSTFAIDKVKYYNEIIARIGEENITRFELITAYNNYGRNNFLTQGGQTEKEALLSTAESLVERKMLVKYALSNPDKYTLSNYEVNKVFEDTIDSLTESFASTMETARKIYQIEEPKDTEESKTVETKKISDFKYEKRVKIVKTEQEEVVVTDDGEVVKTVYGSKLQYINTDTDKDFEYVIDSKYITDFTSYSESEIVNTLLAKFMDKFYTNTYKEENYSKLCDKALQLACQNLMSYEYYLRDAEGKKLSSNQNDLLTRYVQRTYSSILESAYITKVNTVYLAEEELSKESIVLAYQNLYKNDYALYKNDTKAYADKIINTGTSNGTDIYYTPDSNSEFGYFLHVLLPLGNVEQELKDLKADRIPNYITDEEYKLKQYEILNKIECQERAIEDIYEDGKLIYEEGQVMADKKLVGDVLKEYETQVKDLNSFVEFMFRYSTDDATLTADMPYVMGYNTKTDDKYSGMVDNFTNEGIRLMKLNSENSSNLNYTQSNEYILSKFGIHLLYYIGEVVNHVEFTNLAQVTVEILDSKLVNPATGETMLDKIFDLVYPAGSDGMFTTNTKYSTFETQLIESLYSQYDEELLENKIKASNKV